MTMKQKSSWLVAAAAALGVLGAGWIPSQAAAQAPSGAGAAAALKQLQAAGKYAFVVFVRDAGTASQGMKASAQAAASKTAGKAEVLEVSIADPAQAPVVKQFDVSRAPMPLALIVAPNGAVMGGYPQKAEEKHFLGSMSGPGMEKVMKSIQDKRLVFLCIQNDKTQDNDAAMRGVKEFKADPRWALATDIVKLDPENPGDAKWLDQFKVGKDEKQAVTVFIAPPGIPVATYRGATDKATIMAKLQSASSACASGCGPGGCK